MTARQLIRSIVRKHWAALAGAGGSTVVLTLADLLQPWPLKWVIDGVLGDHGGAFSLDAADVRKLALIAAAVLAIALAGAVAAYAGELWLKRAGERITHELRVAMYEHLQRLSLAFHDRRQKGDLVARLTEDVNAVGTLFSDIIGTMAQAVLVLAGMVVISLIIDPLLGLVMLAIAPLLFGVSVHYRRQVKLTARKQRKREGEIASLAAESLSAMRVIKAFGGERFEAERVSEHSEQRRRFGVQVASFEARFGGAVDVLGAVTVAAVLIIGTLRVAAGVISVGDLVVIAQYARKLYRPLSDLAKQSTKAARSMARAERVAEVLAADEVLEERPGAFAGARAQGVVDLDDVRFSYVPDRPVLDGLSLHLDAGRRVAVVGSSGAGKSTVGALIARFYDPNEGRVLLDGRDARDCSLAWLRGQVGLLLQDTVLFSGTVADNIAYGTDATREEIVRAAVGADADRFVGGLPEGYDTVLGPQGVGFSGGQRQRIGIARVLLRDPSVLVLDEPTTGLDAASEAQVMEGLETLMRDRTTILITHSIALARTADRVVVLDAGRVVQDGTPEELLERPGAFRGLAAEQGLVPRRRRGAPPADRQLPALRALLDPDTAAGALEPSLDGAGELESVAVQRVRYEPGRRVDVLYDVVVSGRHHGVAVRSGPGAREAAEAAEAVAAARRVNGRSPVRMPLAYERRLDALVQWLPLDVALPLSSVPPAELARRVGAPVATAVEVVSYAPGRRLVLRVGGLLVRGYASDAAFERADAAWRAVDGTLGGAAGPPVGGRPAGRLPDLRALVVAAPGLAPAGGDHTAAEAGALLRRLHFLPVPGLEPLRLEALTRRAERSAAVLEAVLPLAAGRATRLAERLAACPPPAAPSVVVHGAFEARELVRWRGPMLAAADAGSVRLAAPAADIASYAADAAARAGGGARHALSVVDGLLDGYGGRPAGLRWHLAAALLRTAERPFRAQEEEWPARVEAGLAAAEDVLAG